MHFEVTISVKDWKFYSLCCSIYSFVEALFFVEKKFWRGSR